MSKSPPLTIHSWGSLNHWESWQGRFYKLFKLFFWSFFTLCFSSFLPNNSSWIQVNYMCNLYTERSRQVGGIKGRTSLLRGTLRTPQGSKPRAGFWAGLSWEQGHLIWMRHEGQGQIKERKSCLGLALNCRNLALKQNRQVRGTWSGRTFLIMGKGSRLFWEPGRSWRCHGGRQRNAYAEGPRGQIRLRE